jgi:GNAT superfamily N-acetyltransferase
MITIENVSKHNWPSLVQLFEGSKECSDCWCMNHRRNPSNCPNGTAAKNALLEEINSGKAYGLLAFINGKPCGWCAVDPVNTQIGHDYFLESVDGKYSAAWMIHCLYVDPAHRGAGISKALISAAIDLAKFHGAKELLAFPIPENFSNKFPKDIAEFLLIRNLILNRKSD